MRSKQPWIDYYDEGVSSNLVYPKIPLPDLMLESARKFPFHLCLQYGENKFTYGQVAALSRQVALNLKNAGLVPGESVGLVLPNVPQFVFAYFGILLAGGVVVPLNPVYTLRELAAQCRQTQVHWLIGWGARSEVLRQIRQECDIKSLFLTDDADLSKPGDALAQKPEWRSALEIPFSVLLAATPKGEDLPHLSYESPAVLQFSGGTTGTPKAVVALHRNLVANSLQFREWLHNLKEGQEHFLTVIPLSHVYGMVIGLNVGLAMGAAIHLLPDARDTHAILECIQSQNISFYPGVPAMYFAINQNPEVRAGHYSLRSIKACISGSAPLDPEIRKTFEALTGGKLVEGYGLSEAPTATHCNPILGENRSGSIGLPLPDVDSKIVPLPGYAKGIGELWVRGPQVMPGYFEQVEETQLAFSAGWLKTGDIGRMDRDGYFYLLGRNKDLIKVSGNQVWPREVEEVLAQLPQVKEAAVAGIPDLAKGERVKAWVVLREGQFIEEQRIIDFCRDSLAHFKVPGEIVFVPALPRTPVGKLLRRELVNLK